MNYMHYYEGTYYPNVKKSSTITRIFIKRIFNVTRRTNRNVSYINVNKAREDIPELMIIYVTYYIPSKS